MSRSRDQLAGKTCSLNYVAVLIVYIRSDSNIQPVIIGYIKKNILTQSLFFGIAANFRSAELSKLICPTNMIKVTMGQKNQINLELLLQESVIYLLPLVCGIKKNAMGKALLIRMVFPEHKVAVCPHKA